MVQRGVNSPIPVQSLDNALGLGPHVCVALIGAGGKTTTMFALADELSQRGSSVVISTTTKIWKPGGRQVVLAEGPRQLIDSVRPQLEPNRAVVVGRAVNEQGKLVGLPPRSVCELVGSGLADAVLVEADGAAGRSLKVHGEGEPVVPACAQVVIVVAGLDAVGKPVDERTIHRVEALGRVLPHESGSTVDARFVARVLVAAARFTPHGARTIYALNKVDTDRAKADAEEVAAAIRAFQPNARVVRLQGGRLHGGRAEL